MISAYSFGYHKTLNSWERGLNLLVDSGGFSVRKRSVSIDVVAYAEFLHRNRVRVVFNLDTLDVEESIRHQRYLEKHTPTYIIPVYHYSEFLDAKYRCWLIDLIEEYHFIGIGGTVGESLSKKKCLFDFVFSNTRIKTKIHGLGVNAPPLLQAYPFYSVDSTVWTSGGMWGADPVRTHRKDKAKFTGQNYMQKAQINVERLLDYEQYITRLWL